LHVKKKLNEPTWHGWTEAHCILSMPLTQACETAWPTRYTLWVYALSENTFFNAMQISGIQF